MRIYLCAFTLILSALEAASQDVGGQNIAGKKCGEGGVQCRGHPPGCDVMSQDTNRCNILFKYEDAAEFVQMHIEGTKMEAEAAAEYTAVGFSKDNQMGDDAVTACLSNGNVTLSYNPEKNNRPIVDKKIIDETLIFQTSGAADGRYWCTFLQIKEPSEDTTEIFNLVKMDYYILLATGRVILPNKSLVSHSFIRNNPRFPSPSEQTFSFAATNNVIPPPTPQSEPFPQPEDTAAPLYDKVRCSSGLVVGGELTAAVDCDSQWCYIKAMETLAGQTFGTGQAQMGCDPGALCQNSGCSRSQKLNAEAERVCCCKDGDKCADQWISSIHQPANPPTYPEPPNPEPGTDNMGHDQDMHGDHNDMDHDHNDMMDKDHNDENGYGDSASAATLSFCAIAGYALFLLIRV